MSGSGGGGSSSSSSTSTSRGSQSEQPARGGGGRNGGAAGDPCNVVETTRLNSPDKAVLVTLREGDVLKIELREEAPRRLLAKHGNNVAGSITSANHSPNCAVHNPGPRRRAPCDRPLGED